MTERDDTTFLLPGPVTMHPRVRQAMAAPAMNHRGPEFKAILREVRELLHDLFRTDDRVTFLSGSGTAGLESAVGGLLRRDDRVLNLVNGKFSERMHELSRVFASPTALEFEWGKAVDPDGVAAAMDRADYRAVTVAHNETSTGLTNPLPDIARVVRDRGALLIVDGITSVGGIDVRMDEWGVDVLVTGSQKCIAAPAGLAAVAVSDRAYARLHDASTYYTNLKAHLDGIEKDDTPYTPAVPLVLALREALVMLKEEGLDARIRRTATLADATRAAVAALDLELFPDPRFASNTVTAIRYPAGVEDARFRTTLREEHRTILAGGQARLKGKIFRIGHMGIVSMADLVAGFEGIEATLAKLGHKFDPGAGVGALTIPR